MNDETMGTPRSAMPVGGIILAFAILFVLSFGCSEGDPSGGSGLSDDAGGQSALDRLLAINEEPDALLRAARASAFLDALDAKEQASVIKAIVAPGNNRLDALETSLVVRYWARHDPAGAAKWALGQGESAFRDQAVRDTVTAWARVAPEEAASEPSVVQGIGGSNAAALQALVVGWFESQQPGLEDFVRDLGIGDMRQVAAAVLTRLRFVRDGSEATVNWAESLEGDSVYKKTLYRQVGAGLAADDPERAVAFCEKHCDSGLGGSLRQFIAVEWAKHDGASMMKWLSSGPNDLENEIAMRAAYRRWIRTEEDVAYEWVAALSEERRRDPRLQAAVGMYISRVSWKEHLKALDWTKYLIDPSDRELARISTVRRWYDRDPDAADQWMAKSDLLSAEAEEKARSFPENFRRGRRIAN